MIRHWRAALSCVAAIMLLMDGIFIGKGSHDYLAWFLGMIGGGILGLTTEGPSDET